MPITLHTHPEHEVIILVHSGHIPDEEFLAFYQKFFTGGSFDPSLNLLVDLRAADSSPRTSGILRRIAMMATKHLQVPATRPRVAVVAPEDLSFGLARMYEGFSGSIPWDFTVFRAMEAALAWLGLPQNILTAGEK